MIPDPRLSEYPRAALRIRHETSAQPARLFPVWSPFCCALGQKQMGLYVQLDVGLLASSIGSRPCGGARNAAAAVHQAERDAATEKKTPREPWEDARGVEKDWFSRTKPGASAPACSQRVASVRSELASPHRAGSDRASAELVSRGIRATEKKTPRESLGDARGV